MPAIYPTMACFVLQGSKRVTLGSRTLVYRGESYMLLSADLPVTGQVIEATPRAPYLGRQSPARSGGHRRPPDRHPAGAARRVSPGGAGPFGIGGLTAGLQEPLLRLLRLLDTPADIRVLAPLRRT